LILDQLDELGPNGSGLTLTYLVEAYCRRYGYERTWKLADRFRKVVHDLEREGRVITVKRMVATSDERGWLLRDRPLRLRPMLVVALPPRELSDDEWATRFRVAAIDLAREGWGPPPTNGQEWDMEYLAELVQRAGYPEPVYPSKFWARNPATPDR
jgi:hypothetical protein